MPRIAVVGSMNADLTVRTERLPRPGETVTGSELEINPGGKSSNQAAIAARLGGEVGLLALVGDDPHGALLRAEAEKAGVDIRWVGTEPGVATGTAMIAVDDDAENFIIISPGANARLSPQRYAEGADILDGAAVLCLCLEVDQATVLAAAQDATARGVRVILNLSPSAEVDPALLEATDVLLVNEHELADLVGSEDLTEAPQRLAAHGIHQAVVTLGAEGAVVIEDGAGERVSSPAVSAVDTTGAGDAFTGSLALRLAEGDDLLTAARTAARVASFTTTRPGAQRSYPTAEEFAAFRADVSVPGGVEGT